MVEAAEECQAELEAYWNHAQIRPPSSPCGAAQNCLLNSLQEYTKATFSTAAILLGLLPTILGFIGPVLQDTAVLMIRRPFLASLITIGSPATSPIPLLSHAVDLKLERPSAVMLSVGAYFSRYKPSNPRTRSAVILLATVQYLLAFGAVANTIHVAVQLDYTSVIVWHCSAVGYPEGWVVTSVLIHWVSAASLWCGTRMEKTPHEAHELENKASIFGKLLGVLKRWLASEFIPSIFQPLPDWISHIGHTTVASNILSCFSSMMILAHYVIGTLVFSSFLFIGTPGASIILCRFIGSALICRLLLWLEHDSLCTQYQAQSKRSSLENSISLEPSRHSTADRAYPKA
ncbi:hypothetical protein DM02DRAFT_652874 [Periconia macrospinosa]|uniref:Uncharacterized protein n=1 Tax=Periconia macrospinosa TaxID=97972 RepID=A0A2V1DXK4_9PLEO|nr:hypothetical protein DM02DRAFT_652874 [Periconia macrospinosa]